MGIFWQKENIFSKVLTTIIAFFMNTIYFIPLLDEKNVNILNYNIC